jgi:thiol-disulfide isomerase/thioredoxin
MEEGRIRYSYAAALMMYPVGHRLMARNPLYTPEDAYYEVIREYAAEDEKWASLDEYRSFMAEAMHVLDEGSRGVKEIYPKTVAQVKYAADFIKNAAVREAVIHYIATTYVDNFGVKDMTELENLYYTYVKDEAMLASMKTKIERWDKSLPGKMSPGFKAVDIDGKEYTLDDFRGKYVYIDMWATWCAPCKRELPYLKALEKEFADAQIVFLGLSVDKDKAAWEKMVRSGELTGVQLYLGTQSKFQQEYKIEGIPRFILLDKAGRIISNDMTRPSEDATAETLRNLKDIR